MSEPSADHDATQSGPNVTKSYRSARSTIMLSIGWLIGLSFAACFGYLAGSRLDDSTPPGEAVGATATVAVALRFAALESAPASLKDKVAKAIDDHPRLRLNAATARAFALPDTGRAALPHIRVTIEWTGAPQRLHLSAHTQGLPRLRWANTIEAAPAQLPTRLAEALAHLAAPVP